ncbi:MAG: Ig-like domain-containing protein [Thermoplasmata archaeon]|nr:Ig-like domain-containing protein [Thermoplasmata archaeon]
MKRMGNTRFGLFGVGATVTLLLTSFVLIAPAANAQTYVTGEISGTQTWDSTGSPYIATGDLYITGSLTIQTGTNVLFNDGLALYVEDQLNAGIALFNENGSSLIPWKGIQFNSTSFSSSIVTSNITASTVGIFIDGTLQPPLLTGTTIYGTGIGLIVSQSDPLIKFLTVSSSTSYSVVTSNSSMVLENSTLTGAANDFLLDNSSHVSTLNTSFTGSVSVVNASSDLTVKNFLDILVLDENNNPLQGADINVTDIPPLGPNQTAYSSSHFGGVDPQTNSSGEVSWIVVTDRTYNETGAFDNQTRIEIFYPGKNFSDNPRFRLMESSHTETFFAIGPSEPPRVTAWSPEGGGILVDTPIDVTFSKPMNTTSVEQSLKYNDGKIVRDSGHGGFAWTGNVSFVFTPDEPYACCTQYNVTLLSSTAKDDAGQYLDGDGDGNSGPDFLWNFTTEVGPPPVVNSTRPSDGKMDVSVSSNIIVTFDRPMDKSSVAAAFSYTDGIGVWNRSHGEIVWASEHHIFDNMIFNPFENFNTSTDFNVTINGTVAKDNCGSYLSGGVDYTWGFTTELEDLDPPRVIGNIPQAGQIDVDVTTVIEIRFSENMNTDDVNDSFSYTDSTTTWDKSDGNVTWNMGKDNFTFTPTMSLYYGRTYTVTLDATVASDASGNPLDGDDNGVGGDDYSLNFKTEVIPDSTPPTVVSASPTGTGVPVTENIVVEFSELMDESSVQRAFYYTDGIKVVQEGDGTFVWNGDEVTFIPDPEFALDYGTEYTVTITQSAMDRSSNQLAEDYSWSFTTDVGSGNITGKVRDENGVALADVTVTIEILDMTVHTFSNGSYIFEDIPAGSYTIRFSKEGFNGVTRPVDLEPNQVRELNVTLTHTLTLFDLWWMILLIVILVVILFMLLWWRKRRAQTWPGAQDVTYVEPPPEPPPEISEPDDIDASEDRVPDQ